MSGYEILSKLKFQVLTPLFGICRLDSGSGLPVWASQSEWHCVTRTADEVSVVCEASAIPPDMACERDWRGFRIAGTMDFSLTGILAAVSNTLADADISLFSVSTYDTDYFFVKTTQLAHALNALEAGGAGILSRDAVNDDGAGMLSRDTIMEEGAGASLQAVGSESARKTTDGMTTEPSAETVEVTVTTRNIAPQLAGDRITLRRPRRSDIADRIRTGRQAEFVHMCGGDSHNIPPLDEAAGEDWYAHILTVPYEWIIDLNGRCIGVARLTLTECDNRARYAVALFDSALYGKGIGTEVTRMVLRFAFLELKLHRVDLNVLTYNRRAIACYEKCGFRPEGIDREDAWIDGQWASDMRMGILEEEWRGDSTGLTHE